MSFFDFVGALGAGGGEMARTISDIERRKLEEQENMDRIAMQREQMMSADARQQAGFDFNTNMFDAEGVRATEALAELRLYDDTIDPRYSVDAETGETTFLPFNKTPEGEEAAARRQGGLDVAAAGHDYNMGEIGARAAAVEDAAVASGERAETLRQETVRREGMVMEAADILKRSGGGVHAARPRLKERWPNMSEDQLDEIQAMAVQYSEDLRRTGGFLDMGDMSIPQAHYNPLSPNIPSEVPPPNVVPGDGNGVGASGGIPERIGAGAHGFGSVLRQGLANQVSGAKQWGQGFMENPYQALQFGDDTARSVDARSAIAYKASAIDADLEAGIITREQADQRIAELELEAAGGN